MSNQNSPVRSTSKIASLGRVQFGVVVGDSAGKVGVIRGSHNRLFTFDVAKTIGGFPVDGRIVAFKQSYVNGLRHSERVTVFTPKPASNFIMVEDFEAGRDAAIVAEYEERQANKHCLQWEWM